MSTIAQKRAFCERHFRTPAGLPFSLAGREWVLEELWRSLDGFKLWPRAPGRTEGAEENDHPELCDACLALSGTITEWSEETFDHPSLFGLFGSDTAEQAEHHASGCTGLVLEPTVFTWIDLPRREGKTFNFFGYGCSTLAIDSHVGITFVAGSEGQSDSLFEENFKGILERSEGLDGAYAIKGTRVTWKKTRSFLEYVPTSARSITGKGRSHVVIDESRDFDPRTMMALWPSILANNGVMCPRGHVHGPRDPRIQIGATRCPVPGCNRRLIPWYGRALFMSSAGVIDDKSWHSTGIDRLLAKPDRNHHAYRRQESQNPNVHVESKDAGARVFRDIPATADLVAVEVDNVSTRRGEMFLDKAQVSAVIDKSLRNVHGYARRAIGFLDTSETGHLTSLCVIAEDEERLAEVVRGRRRLPFDVWRQLVLEIWDPQNRVGTRTVRGSIIDESTVLPWFQEYMPLFPLLDVWVDTRARPWAQRFVRLARAGQLEGSKSWGKRVHAFEGSTPERRAGYDTFAEDVIERRCTLIDHPVLRKEFEAARKKRNARDKGVDIREEQGHAHLDVVDNLAACCYQKHLVQVERRTSLAETGQADEVHEIRRHGTRTRDANLWTMITDSLAGERFGEDDF